MKNLISTLAMMAAAGICGAGCSMDADAGARSTAADAGVPSGAGGNGASIDAIGPYDAGRTPSQAELEQMEAPRCGAGPHQPMWLAAEDLMGPANNRQLGEVVVTLKQCPESRFMTGADGRLLVMVTRAAETWVRFEKLGYLPWMVGEVAVTEALPRSPVIASMVPEKIRSSVVPMYRTSEPLVYLTVQMGRSDAPEPCRTREGVVLSVKGHPEAQVSYRAEGSNGDYQKSSATTIEGVAIISGLLPTATAVEIAALKPGCSYRLAYGDVNSAMLLPILRTPLSPGTITHQVINPVR